MGLSRGRRSTKICRKPSSIKGFLLVRVLTYLKLNKCLTFHQFTRVLVRPKSHDLQEQQNNSCQIWLICTVSQKKQKKEYYSFFSAVTLMLSFPPSLKALAQEAEREKESKHSSKTNLMIFFGHKDRLIFLATYIFPSAAGIQQLIAVCQRRCIIQAIASQLLL